MNINTKTTAVSLTPEITKHLDRRLEKVKNILRDDSSIKCDIELARTTAHHQKGDVFMAEIHIVGRKNDIFARSEASDLLTAIDEVCSEILRSLTSRNKRYIDFVRRGGAQAKNLIKGLWPWGNNGNA